MRKQLQRHWFAVLVILLLATIAFNLARSGEKYFFFAKGFFYRGALVDVPRWQAWTERNHDFFGPLTAGTCIAIVSHPNDFTGIIIRKSATGMEVSRSHFLRSKSCAVAFAMNNQGAEKLLELSLPEQGDDFWDAIKRETGAGTIQVFTWRDLESLKHERVIEFLRSFDARRAS